MRIVQTLVLLLALWLRGAVLRSWRWPGSAILRLARP